MVSLPPGGRWLDGEGAGNGKYVCQLAVDAIDATEMQLQLQQQQQLARLSLLACCMFSHVLIAK